VEKTTSQYFPAYEIAMDELRDYRFYKRDMVHLNDVGIDFIWSRFRESGINTNTVTQQKAVEKYRKLIEHKPTNHQAHEFQVQKMKEELLRKFPKTHL
jgi:predicted TPR repeat methyltransferase